MTARPATAAPAPAPAQRARPKPHLTRRPGLTWQRQPYARGWYVCTTREATGDHSMFLDALGPYRDWRDAALRAAAWHRGTGR